MKIIFVIVYLFISSLSFSQVDRKVDITEFIREIQIWDRSETNMSLAWWLPRSYWRIVLADNSQISQETISQIENTYNDFVFLCAANLQINLNGSMTYDDYEKLKETISITDNNGTVYYPLEREELTYEVNLYNDMIKPMFAQILGQFGEGMHFYFFEIKDKQGNNKLNENSNDDFTVKHSDREFTFNLPLVSLLPPKICPIDSMEMKGNWIYCPFHGVKLIDKK